MGAAMRTLGHYQQPGEGRHEWEVVFSHPDRLPFQWAHCDLTANALAAYFAPFFPEEGLGSLAGRDDLTFSASYVVNELLENAQKFGVAGTVRVRACLTESDLLVWVSNPAAAAACRNLESVIAGILQGDPQQLLLERIEHNALNPGNQASGLGYLTMMSDYGVRFGWSFREGADAMVQVETQAWLPLQRKNTP